MNKKKLEDLQAKPSPEEIEQIKPVKEWFDMAHSQLRDSINSTFYSFSFFSPLPSSSFLFHDFILFFLSFFFYASFFPFLFLQTKHLQLP